MHNDISIIVSDEESLKFAREYYPKNTTTSRRVYTLPFHFLLRQGLRIPCFLSNNTCQHHQDVQNIELILKRRKIRKKELSLVIFDAHTDMYHCDGHRGDSIRSIQGNINMTNWVLEMSRMGYDNISIVGVSDFTRSSSELDGQEYFRFADRIKFFLGQDFDSKIDFEGDSFDRNHLKRLEDFFIEPLRSYTFVSLDSDVSEDFAGHPMPTYTGYRGKTRISELVAAINYIKSRSQIIGFSLYGMYGMGFYSTFSEKKEELKEVLDAL